MHRCTPTLPCSWTPGQKPCLVENHVQLPVGLPRSYLLVIPACKRRLAGVQTSNTGDENGHIAGYIERLLREVVALIKPLILEKGFIL